MSRLIDADTLINKIRGIVPGPQDVDFIEKIIEGRPIAFDMEKVVEQLEEKQYAYIHDNGDYAEGKYYAFEEAIDIVKKGGVE